VCVCLTVCDLETWTLRQPRSVLGCCSTDKQDRQCTYNGILRRVRVTIVAVEELEYYIFWVCVCSLSYPACKAHAPYCIVICGLFGCIIFFHNTSQMEGFSEKKVIEPRKRVLFFSTSLVWNISHSKKNWGIYYNECTYVFTSIIINYCQILTKLEFSQHIFRKCTNIKFN
jgi:hypothetical protein